MRQVWQGAFERGCHLMQGDDRALRSGNAGQQIGFQSNGTEQGICMCLMQGDGRGEVVRTADIMGDGAEAAERAVDA